MPALGLPVSHYVGERADGGTFGLGCFVGDQSIVEAGAAETIHLSGKI